MRRAKLLVHCLTIAAALGVAALSSADAQVRPGSSSVLFFNESKIDQSKFVTIPNIGGVTGWTLPGSDVPIKFSGYLTQCPFSASSCFYNYAGTSPSGPAGWAFGSSYGGQENFADANLTSFYQLTGGNQKFVKVDVEGFNFVAAIAGNAAGQDEKAIADQTWSFTNQTGTHKLSQFLNPDATARAGPLVSPELYNASFEVQLSVPFTLQMNDSVGGLGFSASADLAAGCKSLDSEINKELQFGDQPWVNIVNAVRPKTCYQGLAISDPSVSIDPAFLAQDPGVTLEFSANIQQFAPTAGSVPEPSTWALLALGFAGFGLARARRRAWASSARQFLLTVPLRLERN
jgi:hypothetical protein